MNQSEEVGANESSKTDVLFVGFNQDGTSLAIGTTKGYKLYSILSVEKLELIYENTTEKDVCIVERLFSSSLVAIVSLNAHRMLKVCHFKKGSEICNYSYSNTILAVRLNRLRLIVCLEESLYIHNIRNMEVLHTIRDTPPNTLGLCCLVPKDENCYLAYPGSSTIGEVQIFDASNLKAVSIIAAHDSPLAAMAFDPEGKKLATASEKGTVIRVFAVQTGDKLFELRRGMKRCVTMYSLSFSPDSLLLSSSSNTETIHVFKLEHGDTGGQAEQGGQGWMGYLTRGLVNAANYLPSQVADVVNQGRSFATVRHPFAGVRNIGMIASLQKISRLLVASADGYLYIYAIDPNEGGDCTLLKQHKLDKAGVVGVNPADIPPEHPPASTPISYAAAVNKQTDKGALPSGSLGSERGHDGDESPPPQRPET